MACQFTTTIISRYFAVLWIENKRFPLIKYVVITERNKILWQKETSSRTRLKVDDHLPQPIWGKEEIDEADYRSGACSFSSSCLIYDNQTTVLNYLKLTESFSKVRLWALVKWVHLSGESIRFGFVCVKETVRQYRKKKYRTIQMIQKTLNALSVDLFIVPVIFCCIKCENGQTITHQHFIKWQNDPALFFQFINNYYTIKYDENLM